MEAIGDVSGLDTGWIVIGGGTRTIAVEQEGGHIAFVQSSRIHHYDPRIHEAFADAAQRAAERAHMRTQVIQRDKWCSHCGDIRPRSYFSPRPDTHDGLQPHCKQCRNEDARRRYALQAAEDGREVRAYKRREQRVIEGDFAPVPIKKAA